LIAGAEAEEGSLTFNGNTTILTPPAAGRGATAVIMARLLKLPRR
jgi:hypothetical protein